MLIISVRLLAHHKFEIFHLVTEHRRGLKKRIFHVLRFVMESSKYRPYVEIQRINTEAYDYGAKDTPERENTAGREKQREVMINFLLTMFISAR